MPSSTPIDHPPDVLITNVTIWSGEFPKPQHHWMAIKDGLIADMGAKGQQPPEASTTINGQGQVILPSFVDCHTHISAGSIANICRNGSALNSKEDALQAITVAASQDDSDWLVMFYVDWNAWDNPQPPTAQELEDAAQGRPVILICESLHRAILSESGLRACNVSRYAHSEFVESIDGVLNGIVWEEVFSICLEQVLRSVISSMGEAEFSEVLQAEANRHLAHGITDAHDPCVTLEMSRAMQQLNDTTALRISWSEVGKNGPLSSAGDGQSLDNFGDGPSSAKVFTDGAHRCAMCIEAKEAIKMTLGMFQHSVRTWNFSPLRQFFNDETVYRNGHFYRQGALFEADQLTNTLRSLNQTHDRIKIHALGNHAVDMTCDCLFESGITTKVCLEHATVINDDNIENLANLGVQVSAQPGFLPHYGEQFTNMRITGKYRGLAFRSMLDAGVDLIMSSDYPCGPLDPLHNMRCAVERKLSSGRTYLEKEAVSEEEAVYAYTVAGMKGITGKPKPGLVAGAPADFVILSDNPFKAATTVVSTWVDGNPVYTA